MVAHARLPDTITPFKLTFKEEKTLRADNRLSASARLLYQFLADSILGRLTWFRMSHAVMMKALQKSRSSIIRYLAELEDLGYLVKRHNAVDVNGRRYRIANSYRLIPPQKSDAQRIETKMDLALHRRKALDAIQQRQLKFFAAVRDAVCSIFERGDSPKEFKREAIPSQSAADAMRQCRRERESPQKDRILTDRSASPLRYVARSGS